MKKGELYEGVVESLTFPTKGIVRVEGEADKAMVKNALPGQRISFRVSKKRKGKAEGTLLEVLEKAPNEIAPACPHFGLCGGCAFQNLAYEDQLSLKSGQVQKLLDEVYINSNREIGYTFEGVKRSPKQFGYRNKMEFSFGDEYKDGPLSLGLHKNGSFYDIIPVTDCRIVDEDYRLILRSVLQFFSERKISYYHRMRQEGYLRHLLLRKAEKTGQILTALVTSKDTGGLPCAEKELLDDFTAMLLSLKNEGKLSGDFAGIIHTVNASVADVVKADANEILYGEDYFYEELMGLTFKISQFSFFQTNSLGAEVLYDTARSYILDTEINADADKVVYDLYSGTGTIAQMMAPVCKKVIGVEIVEEAVEAAKRNAEINGLHNCEFIAGDVLKVLDEIDEKPDFIILDPPRDGIHPKALKKIIDYGVDWIVYISCKPTSLARDLAGFLENGYGMKKAVCVDMFPATANIETVVLLSQQKPDDYVEVNLELDELDITCAESKATYDEIKKYIADHNNGLKVSSLNIAQVKKKYGIEMGKNYNQPKSADSRQPKCPKEKEKVIEEALRHFCMI